jgi:branched-chain amino acid transport system substrate-binding protein
MKSLNRLSKVMAALAFSSTAFAVTVQSAQDVHIGLASNFSEVSSSSSNPYGDYFRNGVRLAIKDAKPVLDKRGINIVFEEFDYGTNQVKVLDAANRAVKSDVIGVLGYNFSSHALLAAPIHQQAKLPMLTPSATADRIGHMGHYVHTGCFDNAFMGKTLAQIAWNRLKVRKAAMVIAADCAYCVDLAQGFEREFTAKGGVITVRKDILETDKDFSAVVEALKHSPSQTYDAILIPNQELISARIISSILKAGINKPFLGGDGWGDVGDEFFSVIGDSKLSGYSVSHWHPDLKTARSQKFVRDFQKQFGKKPNDTSVLAYDSTLLLVDALLHAKEFTRSGLEEALNNIKQFDGVTGHSTYIAGAAPQKSLTLLSAKNTKFTPIEMVNPIPSLLAGDRQ